MNKKRLFVFSLITILTLACSAPFFISKATEPAPPAAPLPAAAPTATTVVAEVEPPTISPPTSTPTPAVVHIAFPGSSPLEGGVIYDVISQDTAKENRAPYGDSYKINRLERPFQQDMIYVPDLDIATFSLSSDETWYYISIEMIGKDPNNEMGIDFGVEIDDDGDGFGDLLVWAQPPYTDEWTNSNVMVFEDTNHDTAGLSPGLSDAPLDTTNGYDSALLDILNGIQDDPDLAWVRSNAGLKATIQFAFKKSLTDNSFMLGVIADAGLRDVSKLDYVDRFLEEDAGSPVRSNKYYPLGELYLVDNTCQEAFGYKPTGYEPKLCPRPEPEKKPPDEQTGCTNPSQYTDGASCTAAGCAWVQNPNVFVAVVYYCTYP